ncbi:MAG: cupin domain-containing protein [Nanoarchaeota archaeon]
MKIKNLFKELEKAELDEKVGIRHAIVADGDELGMHIAEIHDHVNAHVHMKGDEIYLILKGKGEMHTAKFGEVINWDEPKIVEKDDVFVIGEKQVHHLKNIGDTPLVISFICPHTHLTTDRKIIDNP